MTSPRALLLAPAAAAALLASACGSGLYDAAGLPPDAVGPGQQCDAGLVSCANVCTVEDTLHCGTGCQDCSAGATAPAGGVLACLGAGTTHHGSCGYACQDGLLKCAGGCCGTQALAAGPSHSCALLSDGAVRCWGANATGQLGTGDTQARTAPAAVPLTASAVALGLGTGHGCAVVAGGAVQCWGANAAGQVTGTPSASPVLSPAATPVTSGATAVVAGASHTCALLTSGAVRCWGAADRTGGGTPVTAGATAVAAGRDHTCAVVGVGGAVQCWGLNTQGQLGGAPDGSGITTPIASGITLVAAGGNQTCAATGASNGLGIDDSLRCWGDSVGAGYLLDVPQLTPKDPRRDASRSTVQYEVGLLAAGSRFVCLRKKTESVECLGANDAGQLGGTPLEAGVTVTVPLPAVAAPVVRALATGDAHACAALAPDGRLRCWGSNASGQLGDGTTTSPAVGVLATPAGG